MCLTSICVLSERSRGACTNSLLDYFQIKRSKSPTDAVSCNLVTDRPSERSQEDIGGECQIPVGSLLKNPKASQSHLSRSSNMYIQSKDHYDQL